MKTIVILFGIISINIFAQINGELRYNDNSNHTEIFIDLTVFDSLGTVRLREAGYNYAATTNMFGWFNFDSLFNATPNGIIEHNFGEYDLKQILIIKSWFKTFLKEKAENER